MKITSQYKMKLYGNKDFEHKKSNCWYDKNEKKYGISQNHMD